MPRQDNFEKRLENAMLLSYKEFASVGLNINQNAFAEGSLRQQVRFAPYGIMDLFNSAYFPATNTLFVQIIELKAVAIDARAYHQVKRYQHGIERLFAQEVKAGLILKIEVVLIGDSVKRDNAFLSYLQEPTAPRVFTYYWPNAETDEIAFKELHRDAIVFDEVLTKEASELKAGLLEKAGRGL